ncbi:hypothetical protein D9615_006282 [Tricholomella constricta]|uniref:Uncharacterized protein n=1 Tax=Tricholomella constricta TaxID=117010 RepID=A0A8H5HBA6_9AGAR|nr:hypothetical protein D9615_006282 [Tricholomella constricta]
MYGTKFMSGISGKRSGPVTRIRDTEGETKRSMDEQQIAPIIEAAKNEVTALVEVAVASKFMIPQDDQAHPKSKQKLRPFKRGRYIRNSGHDRVLGPS